MSPACQAACSLCRTPPSTYPSPTPSAACAARRLASSTPRRLRLAPLSTHRTSRQGRNASTPTERTRIRPGSRVRATSSSCSAATTCASIRARENASDAPPARRPRRRSRSRPRKRGTTCRPRSASTGRSAPTASGTSMRVGILTIATGPRKARRGGDVRRGAPPSKLDAPTIEKITYSPIPDASEQYPSRNASFSITRQVSTSSKGTPRRYASVPQLGAAEPGHRRLRSTASAGWIGVASSSAEQLDFASSSREVSMVRYNASSR